MSRNVSSISLTGPVPNVGYKTFEHHLRPDGSGDGSRASRPSSKNHKYNKHTLSPVRFFRSNHPHHSHHIRDRDRNDITTPKSGIHELPPEVIIEAVFNPHPATEEGPFTFVPAAKGERLEHEDAAMDRVLEWADPSTAEDERVNGNGKEHKLGWGGRMRARKERKEKERQSKVVA